MRNTQLLALRIALGMTALALVVGNIGCRQSPEPEPEEPVGERIENPEAGVAIAGLPSIFELVGLDGERILLKLSAADAAGELVVTPGEPEVGGVNLVAAVEDHQQEILQRPGGDYKGQRELGSHLGTAFYSRGRYQTSEDAEEIEEETVIFLVHPWQDRILKLIYRYPAGDDSSERIQDHLFVLLEQIEPLPAAPEAAAGGGSQ